MARTLEQLKNDWHTQDNQIQAAYWAFCRSSNAKPPSLVCPDAYTKRAEIETEMRRLRDEAQGGADAGGQG